MDHLTRLKRQVNSYLAAIVLLSSSVLVGSWLLMNQVAKFNLLMTLIVLIAEVVVLTIAVPQIATKYLIQPIEFLWQAIVHVSPGSSTTPAPNLEQSKLGRELVTSLCLQIYQLASNIDKAQPVADNNNLQASSIANSLPLPVLVMDKSQSIIFANDAAYKYLGRPSNELVGQNLYSCLNLSFGSNDTFDNWLNLAKQNAVTSSRSWERVHLKLPGHDQPQQLDLAAYYNKANPSGVETIITLFDHTATYGKEDNSISYVALAVHELRIPLTLLRGYIEIFEDELADKLDPELAAYLNKMEAATKRLTAFINNILNIARVEANQLVLHLQEENWNNLVSEVANDLKSQATARGKTIELELDPKLPPVAADRINIYEVISNLIDNALKYSDGSETITIKTCLVENNMIQTTVQDWGVGIPANVLPHLFEKFQRSHRTSDKISGTGLGLYLSKIIVEAHGGHIWVRSFEEEGTTVGFTIKPYSQLADEAKNSDNKEIERNAYGWIKNHSLYRK